MKKFLFSLCLLGILASVLPLSVSAQAGAGNGGTVSGTVSGSSSPAMLDKLKAIGGQAGYDSGTDGSTLLTIVGTVINSVLGLLGVIFIILIIVAGFNWMTAGGDEEKIKKSGDNIRSAIIGLLIIVGAFAIWAFINAVLISGAATASPTYS